MSLRATLAAALIACLSPAAAAAEAPGRSSAGKPAAGPAAGDEKRTVEAKRRIERIDTLFRAGMAAMGAALREKDKAKREALLDRAIAAFHAILVRHPGLVRVHLELARAFYLKGEDGLARRHFERVLAGKPPKAVVANIQRFLASIRARRRWQARFGMGLSRDSNLNSASGDRVIWLDTAFGRLPFTRQGEIAPKAGFGVSLWGGGEYQQPLAGRLRLRIGGDVSIRESQGSDFDRYSGSLYIGPRWLAGPRTEVSLLGVAQRRWTAGAPHIDTLGFRIEGAHRLTPRFTLSGRAGTLWQACFGCEDRDGPIHDLALDGVWRPLAVLRVRAGGGYSWTRAEEKAWRSAGPQARIGASLDLPRGFTVGAQAAFTWTGYEGDGRAHFTDNGKPRRDRFRTLSLSVHNRAVTLWGFSPRLSVVNQQRETNAQTLGFRRTHGELSFVRQF